MPQDPAALALKIDEYYDSLLYDGMHEFELLFVENRRQDAHAKAMKQALEPDGSRRL